MWMTFVKLLWKEQNKNKVWMYSYVGPFQTGEKRVKRMGSKTFTNKGRRTSLGFCCIHFRIYSTININRLREDWSTMCGHIMFYIRVKYTMKNGEEMKTLQLDSVFGKRAGKIWTHTHKRTALSLTGCPEVRFVTELPQNISSSTRDVQSKENFKHVCIVTASQNNQDMMASISSLFIPFIETEAV